MTTHLYNGTHYNVDGLYGVPDDPADREAYLNGMFSGFEDLVDSYWIFSGEAAAMIDLLLKTTYAEILDKAWGNPSMVIDGDAYRLDLLVREKVSRDVHQIIALIEGHGETRH